MHLKRFRGATVTEALQAVRSELGADALVLGTRLVAAAGWRGVLGRREVEISAALEREVSEVRTLAPPRPSFGDDEIVARLAACGFDESVAHDISGRISRTRLRKPTPADLREALEAWSATLTVTAADTDAVDVFVGPPGAGKTTTVAKIAAQARVKHNRRIPLIAADGFRVGAVEQLRLYADIIGSPFTAARSAAELRTAVMHAAGPVLVDTAGRAPRDAATGDLCGVLSELGRVRTHLVLPAASSIAEATRLLDAHAAARPQRVVLTRLDESESIAPLARFLREHQLRVSFLTFGQRVPEDLVPATPKTLAAAFAGDAWVGSAA